MRKSSALRSIEGRSLPSRVAPPAGSISGVGAGSSRWAKRPTMVPLPSGIHCTSPSICALSSVAVQALPLRMASMSTASKSRENIRTRRAETSTPLTATPSPPPDFSVSRSCHWSKSSRSSFPLTHTPSRCGTGARSENAISPRVTRGLSDLSTSSWPDTTLPYVNAYCSCARPASRRSTRSGMRCAGALLSGAGSDDDRPTRLDSMTSSVRRSCTMSASFQSVVPSRRASSG